MPPDGRIVVGIDAGVESVKVALIAGGELRYYGVHPEGTDPVDVVVGRALDQMWERVGVGPGAVALFAATGALAEHLPVAARPLPAPLCLAAGAGLLLPAARTVVDFGAQKIMAIKCREGRPTRIATNDRCAAGSGRYLQMVSNLLQVEPAAMAGLAATASEALNVQSTCAVFAESEIISLIHQRNSAADILKGVFFSLAERVYKTLTQVGLEREVAMVGGVARNEGVVRELEELLGFPVLVPENPEIVGAVGAATVAYRL